MTTVSKQEYLNLSGADTPNSDEQVEQTKIYEGEFHGTLIGNATTAKELEVPYNFTLNGDAEGTTKVNAKDVMLDVKVKHATHADTADFAGKVDYASRTSHAEMANTAEYSYKTGKLESFVLKFLGDFIVGQSELLGDGNTVEYTVDHINVFKHNIIFSNIDLTDNDFIDKLDKTKVYIDKNKPIFLVYDWDKELWINIYNKYNEWLSEHDVHLETINEHLITLDNTTLNHEERLVTAENKLIDHEQRITYNTPTDYTITFNNKEYTMRNTLVKESSEESSNE